MAEISIPILVDWEEIKNYLAQNDIVEVVRCKDCKYSVDEYKDGDCYCNRPESELVWIGKNWDFYCASAKRRTND